MTITENAIPVFIFLSCGALTMFAAAGFTMINAGLSRAHASASICLMSLTGACIAALAFYIVGSVGVFFAGNESAYGGADWFFRATILIAAVCIVMGALAERVQIWAFFTFAAFFGGLIFPAQAAWNWGGGWLSDIGFHDFGGAASLHMAAGAAALAGIRMVGPRAGRFAPEGRAIPFPGSNIPLATLGVMMVFAGWMGINGGHIDGAPTPAIPGAVFMNTLLGGAAGCIGALIAVNFSYRKIDVTLILNGTVAGLVSVSGGADIFSPFFAIIIGAVGGAICVYAIPLLDKYKIDDPVGIVPAHFFGGAWGAVAASFGGNPIVQIAGIALIAAWSYLTSVGVWKLLSRLGVRCPDKSLRHGVDVGELGIEAYPDFPVRTAGRPDITQIDKF